jgi:hypothetical protein
MGPCRLTRAEIRQWEADEAIALARWERRALLEIDAAWVRVMSDTSEQEV